MTEYLYIHIPYCKKICSYCDFCRKQINQNSTEMEKYVDKIIQEVKDDSTLNQYKTIYLGGGTPNYLPNKLLKKLLSFLKKYLNTKNKYEFTIECNPEFVTEEQALIFKQNKVNRISLGVQSTNNEILKNLERNATIEIAQKAIKILQKHNIDNISVDFIYALPNQSYKDLDDSFEFIKNNNIPHVSYYALEVKEGSILNKQKYIIDEDLEADHLEYVIKKFNELGFKRYEVSNWAINSDYESMHNKAYWLSYDWKAIGYGSSGFEDNVMYETKGSYLNWELTGYKLSTKELYLQVLMMGLRLVDGIDVVNNERNKQAYITYFDDIVHCRLKNDHLQCININLLHETLVNIVDETKENQLNNIKNKVYELDDNELLLKNKKNKK